MYQGKVQCNGAEVEVKCSKNGSLVKLGTKY